MKMFSDCSGECCVCACGEFCLAGHGDDDFSPATKEQIIKRLDMERYPSYTDYMKQVLKIQFGYDYEADPNTAERAKAEKAKKAKKEKEDADQEKGRKEFGIRASEIIRGVNYEN